jgi:hypothetical protein
MIGNAGSAPQLLATGQGVGDKLVGGFRMPSVRLVSATTPPVHLQDRVARRGQRFRRSFVPPAVRLDTMVVKNGANGVGSGIASGVVSGPESPVGSVAIGQNNGYFLKISHNGHCTLKSSDVHAIVVRLACDDLCLFGDQR